MTTKKLTYFAALINNMDFHFDIPIPPVRGVSRYIRYSILSLLIAAGFSQSWFNHPELEWQTLETEHFIVHFYDATERSAREAAVVAENIYEPITTLYQFEPDSKTQIIFQDTDDYSNGGAYYYDNKILIWALPLDFDLRGSHRWIQNVLTHEFTHIIQLGASMKYPRQFPASYVQYMGYEKEKRDDVLYGFPNVIISYPFPGTVVPMWFAEGTAQSMYPGADFDYWDSHRDMILRERALNNNLLSLDEMSSFGKRGIGNESVYNQGFSFVLYLRERFGADVSLRITESLRKPFNYSIKKALKDATGIGGQQLYDDWTRELFLKYSQKIEHVQQNLVTGEVLENAGTTNIHPVWSPDETRFAFLSNKNNDYFGQTDLFVYDFKDSSSKKIVARIASAACWLDNSTLVYAKRFKPNKQGSKYFDLYRYDLTTEEEDRLTHDSRLFSPVFNPNTNQLAAITSYDGTSNIMVSDVDEIDFKPLTHETNGMQMISLEWLGNDLYVDAVYDQGRSVYRIDENGDLVQLENPEFDARDMAGNENVNIYASNKSGVFNLVFNSSENEHYITNVTGGAFMPDVSKNGKILYSLYDDGCYQIAIIENPQTISEELVGYAPDYYKSYPQSDLIDSGVTTEARPYKDTMPKPFILPRVMIDYETVKPGFYFFANDVLDKLFVFGAASMNHIKDKDLFLLFEYKKFRPTLYSNLFWVTRHTDQTIYKTSPYDSDKFYTVFNELSIQFFSADIGMRFPYKSHKFWLQYNYTKYRSTINQRITEYNDTPSNPIGIGFDYYHGHNISFEWLLNARKAEFGSNMLPSQGFEINAKLAYELNDFIDGFGFDEDHGTLAIDFKPNNTFRFTVDAGKHFTINHKHKIVSSLETKIETISNKDVDDFFHYFGGGMIGMKGYTFYDSTLSGSSLFINTATLRFPIFLEKCYTFAHMSFQNLAVGLVGQFGGGFSGNLVDWIKDHEYKLSSGIEIRLKAFSFFAYPTSITYEYHLPIDDADEKKGKQYFKVLFDF